MKTCLFFCHHSVCTVTDFSRNKSNCYGHHGTVSTSSAWSTLQPPCKQYVLFLLLRKTTASLLKQEVEKSDRGSFSQVFCTTDLTRVLHQNSLCTMKGYLCFWHWCIMKTPTETDLFAHVCLHPDPASYTAHVRFQKLAEKRQGGSGEFILGHDAVHYDDNGEHKLPVILP